MNTTELLKLRADYTLVALGLDNLTHLEKLVLIGLIQTVEPMDGKVFCDGGEAEEIFWNWLADIPEPEAKAVLDSLVAKGCIACHYNQYGMVGYDILIKEGK